MNETMTSVKQAKGKGDIFAQLFKNKSETPKDGVKKLLLSPFQAVLQESLKKDKKEGVKSALQAIIQKKAELNGAKTVPQGKPAHKDSAGAAKLEAEFSTAIDEAGLSDLAGLDNLPLAAELKKTAMTKDRAGKAVLEPFLSGKPEPELSGKVKPAEEMAGKKLPVPGEAGEKEIKLTVLPVKPLVLEAAAGQAQKTAKHTEKIKAAAPDQEIKNEGEVVPSGIQVSAEEKKARIENAAVKSLMAENEGMDEDKAKALAAQIAAVSVNVGKLVAGKTSSGMKDTAPVADPEAQQLFKAKITEVLVSGGLDQATADRVADQVKKVAFVKETTLPDMASAKPLFDKMLKEEKDLPRLAGSEGKALGTLKGDMPVPEVPVMKNEAMTADTKATLTPKGEKREMRRDEMPLTAAVRDESLQRRESSELESARANIAGDDLPRRENVASKLKPFSVEQTTRTQDSMSQMATLKQAVGAGAEGPVSVQPVRAQEIISQIADLRNAQPDPSGRVKIILDPPHLGTVEMDIIVRGDRVSAVMTTESSQVRQILQSHADEMRQALSDQGFRIDRIEVKQSQEKGADQWENNRHEWNRQQGDGYRQQKGKDNPNQFEFQENMKQFNVVA